MENAERFSPATAVSHVGTAVLYARVAVLRMGGAEWKQRDGNVEAMNAPSICVKADA